MAGLTCLLHNENNPHSERCTKGEHAVPSSFRNLKGPARLLANSATVLLVASSFLAVEAVVIMVLGTDRDVVVKPFILLGYVEVVAMFFSGIGIVCGIVGLIFYHPYLWVTEKLLMRRSSRVRP